MDATGFIDLQEALLWFFGPVFQWLMVLFVAGGVLSMIGALILEAAAQMAK